MADKKKTNKGVTLTPGGQTAEPKLAVVKPDPKTVKVAVPKAKTVAVKDKAPEGGPDAKKADNADLIKKGDLLDEIVAATGVKRSDTKMVLEAFLASASTHLTAGKDMQLPPLGKIKVLKSKDVGNGGTALTIRIRTPKSD